MTQNQPAGGEPAATPPAPSSANVETQDAHHTKSGCLHLLILAIMTIGVLVGVVLLFGDFGK